ncbi:hypothetical protein [Deinococcus rufus]|uniref:Uncharacterized protein n=1 Tax=Deinococcus rufus TaxID=2136097 RepID=A0ABV7Z7S5_9DEIO
MTAETLLVLAVLTAASTHALWAVWRRRRPGVSSPAAAPGPDPPGAPLHLPPTPTFTLEELLGEAPAEPP